MVKITENNIGINRQNQSEKSKSVNKKADSKSAQKSSNVQNPTPAPQDSVQISSTQVSKLDETLDVQKYQELLNKYSEKKLNDLEDYSDKEKAGYYEQKDVINKTTETILNHPGFYKRLSTEKLPVSDNLKQIRNNIENGYYDSDKVLEDIADKLIDSGVTPLER